MTYRSDSIVNGSAYYLMRRYHEETPSEMTAAERTAKLVDLLQRPELWQSCRTEVAPGVLWKAAALALFGLDMAERGFTAGLDMTRPSRLQWHATGEYGLYVVINSHSYGLGSFKHELGLVETQIRLEDALGELPEGMRFAVSHPTPM